MLLSSVKVETMEGENMEVFLNCSVYLTSLLSTQKPHIQSK